MFPAIHPRSPAAVPLAIQRYFELSLYLLLTMGFATLAFTGELGIFTLLFVSAALIFRGYLLATHRVVLLPESWTTVVSLVYATFYLADYFVLSRSFVRSTVHLVLFVMVVRLFSARRDRDYYFLAVIAFLMVLASAVLTVDTTFLLAFVAFTLVAVVTLILMEMRYAFGHATFPANSPNDILGLRQMGFSLAATGPAVALFICLAGTAIFFILPRVSSRYLSAYAPSGQIATGFSDRVQLGQIGIIQQSGSVVMHVQIDGDTHGIYDLKWRGVTLNVFDGTTWSNAHPQTVLRRSLGGRFPLLENAREEASQLFSGGRTIHYRVLMEPLVSNVFFLAPTPVSLEGNYRFVGVDGAGAVYDPDPEHPVSSYEATSTLPQLKPAELRTATQDYPPEILLNYLQLPPLDPRIAVLAAQITASQTDNYDKALAMERYLRTHFAYTLQLPRTSPRDPVAQFLFERKQGHCEYFASAMAVMLRTLRIPARVVNGFRTGEFNDLTAQYVIRASNAHSWVEAYFPEFGWISFDPTPAAPLQVRNGWNRALLYVDAMASFWREWVINYDASHQRTLGQRTGESSLVRLRQTEDWARRQYEEMLDAARRTQRTLSQAPGRWSVTGAVIAMLLVLAANATRLWRAIRRHRVAAHPEKSPGAAATIWYERALRSLARRGLRKLPAQTPAEFVATVRDENMRQSVARLTEHYERARFGDSPEDAARLPELYEEVVSASRR